MSTLSVNVSDFDANPRRKQEIAGRPVADTIYRNLLKSTSIQRNDQREREVLDRFFAIDVSLTMSNGQILTGQEKFLSPTCARFRSITVEYMQNHQTNEPGDWFKLAPMFYFVGYFTPDYRRFDPWVLIDWPRLVLESNAGRVTWLDNRNKDGMARASFRYTIMDKLPTSCIIGSSFNSIGQ